MKTVNLPSIDQEKILLQEDKSSYSKLSSLNDGNAENLPLISNDRYPNNSFIAHGSAVTNERKVVVHNSLKDSELDNNEYEDNEFAHNLDSINKSSDELVKSKLQWENQIARHILTLFANTNSTMKYMEKKNLMQLVDNPTKEELKVIDELKKGIPPVIAPINSKDNNSSKKKIKKKKTLKKELTTENNSELEYFENILKRIENEQKDKGDEYGNKYRVTNTIKTRNGQEIVVRGQAKCYPIWFVSTGEVLGSIFIISSIIIGLI